MVQKVLSIFMCFVMTLSPTALLLANENLEDGDREQSILLYSEYETSNLMNVVMDEIESGALASRLKRQLSNRGISAKSITIGMPFRVRYDPIDLDYHYFPIMDGNGEVLVYIEYYREETGGYRYNSTGGYFDFDSAQLNKGEVYYLYGGSGNSVFAVGAADTVQVKQGLRDLSDEDTGWSIEDELPEAMIDRSARAYSASADEEKAVNPFETLYSLELYPVKASALDAEISWYLGDITHVYQGRDSDICWAACMAMYLNWYYEWDKTAYQISQEVVNTGKATRGQVAGYYRTRYRVSTLEYDYAQYPDWA